MVIKLKDLNVLLGFWSLPSLIQCSISLVLVVLMAFRVTLSSDWVHHFNGKLTALAVISSSFFVNLLEVLQSPIHQVKRLGDTV